MAITFLHGVVLNCLYKINGERTIYSIYHLLNGKKSSQTIQDAKFYQISQYFKTFPKLSREHFDELITDLEREHLLLRTSQQSFLLTEDGLNYLKTFLAQHAFIHYLDGYQFQQDEVFWERLSLIVQVASNLRMEEIKYLPVQRNKDVQAWIKRFLVINNIKRTDLSKMLYDEMVRCLEGSQLVDPSLLVMRLTGFRNIGKTKRQAAELLGYEHSHYHYQFVSLLHFVMSEIHKNEKKYPLLHLLLLDLHEDVPLTDSARLTLKLINNGLLIEEIAKIRKLKLNTIQDHIVEIALQIQSFDISPYVSKELQKRIVLAVKKITSRQLKQIRQEIVDASYFEIRLVMAQLGDNI